MTKTIEIHGMMCAHCKAKVEKALMALPGVSEATVDLDAKTAQVTLTAEVADADLFAAVESKGFTPVKVL